MPSTESPPEPQGQSPVSDLAARTIAAWCQAGAYPAFWLLVMPEDTAPRIAAYDSLEKLQEAIKALIDSGEEAGIYSYAGIQLQLSRAPLRYLITPGGNFPLFELPTEIVPDNMVGGVTVQEQLPPDDFSLEARHDVPALTDTDVDEPELFDEEPSNG